MISLENIIRMVKDVLNEDKGTRLSDSMNIYDKTGIDGVLDEMREHINYVFDSIKEDDVPLAVTLNFTIGLAKVQPENEELEE